MISNQCVISARVLSLKDLVLKSDRPDRMYNNIVIAFTREMYNEVRKIVPRTNIIDIFNDIFSRKGLIMSGFLLYYTGYLYLAFTIMWFIKIPLMFKIKALLLLYNRKIWYKIVDEGITEQDEIENRLKQIDKIW